MKISLIIPAYNAEKYIEKCVNSCCSQDEYNGSLKFEIIIVNDGSRDNTLLIAEELALKYNHIKIISQTNQGLSEARNSGQKKASGDYIWFVDSDDWISSDSFKLLEPVIKENPDIILVQGKYVGKENVLNKVNIKGYVTGQEVLISQNWSSCVPLYIFKKTFLDEHGLMFYPDLFHEDCEFTPRSLYYAEKVMALPYPLYNIYESSNSITRSPNAKKAYDGITIAKLLNEFVIKENIQEPALLSSFNITVSEVINNAFSDIKPFDRIFYNKFNDMINVNSEILKHLRGGRWYHKIEFVLFRFFPNHRVFFFRLLNCLKS